jgi:DtxR family Mn-dependent transcriptional regulator
MLPTSTVENYLKAIYLGQSALAEGERLVTMGHVATALGVTPGTATTMVKALARSGLAEYEPYSGVRLSAAGESLAGLVLRRHRLVELFLVQVMGMKWDEVHEDAEQLEHVVSERLIERIDEMLGRPTHDPAWRSDSGSGRQRRANPVRQPPDLSGEYRAEGDAHRRPGSRVPAVHRAERFEAWAAGARRIARYRR